MALCSATPKVFLSILTAIFWLCAAGLLFVGVTVYVQFNEYEKISQYIYTLLPATIMMATAVFLFIIGLIGCVGAFKEQKCLLGVYFSILLVVLLSAAAGSVLGYVYRNQVESGLQQGLDEALQQYGNPNNTVWTEEIDFMQQQMKCCGVNKTSDWLKTPWHETHSNISYPASCCEDNHCTYKNSTEAFSHGCYSYARQQFMDHLGLVAAVCCGFAVVLLIGMVCSCLLICRRRTEQPYIGLTSPEHLRV